MIGLLVLGLAVSGLVGGLLSAGDRPLAGLDGYPLQGTALAGRFVLAWLCVLAPTRTFAAVGLLGSVALGRSPMGLVTPAVLAVLIAVVQCCRYPSPCASRCPARRSPPGAGCSSSTAGRSGRRRGGGRPGLAGVATSVAYRLFLRRDVTDLADDGSGARLVVAGLLPLALLGVVSALVLGLAKPGTGTGTGSGIDGPEHEGSLATTYAHLYRLQAAELGRPPVTEEQLQDQRGLRQGRLLVEDEGAGNDWRCVVSWHLPGARAVGSAVYQLDVAPTAATCRRRRPPGGQRLLPPPGPLRTHPQPPLAVRRPRRPPHPTRKD